MSDQLALKVVCLLRVAALPSQCGAGRAQHTSGGPRLQLPPCPASFPYGVIVASNVIRAHRSPSRDTMCEHR